MNVNRFNFVRLLTVSFLVVSPLFSSADEELLSLRPKEYSCCRKFIALTCHILSDACALGSIATNATSVLGTVNHDTKLEQDLNLASMSLTIGAMGLRFLGDRLDKDGDIIKIDPDHHYAINIQASEAFMYIFYALNGCCTVSSYVFRKYYSSMFSSEAEIIVNSFATGLSGFGKACDKFQYLYQSKFLNREDREERRKAFSKLKWKEKKRKKKGIKNPLKDYHLIYQGHSIVIGKNQDNKIEARIRMYEAKEDISLGEYPDDSELPSIQKAVFDKLYPKF